MLYMRYIHNIPIRYYMAALAALFVTTLGFEAFAQNALTPQRFVCVAFAEAYITQKDYDGDRIDREFLNKINREAKCKYRMHRLDELRERYALQEELKKRSRSKKAPVRNPSDGTVRAVAGSQG